MSLDITDTRYDEFPQHARNTLARFDFVHNGQIHLFTTPAASSLQQTLRTTGACHISHQLQ